MEYGREEKMTQEEKDMFYEDMKNYLITGIKNLIPIYEKTGMEENKEHLKHELKSDVCILIDKFFWKGGDKK